MAVQAPWTGGLSRSTGLKPVLEDGTDVAISLSLFQLNGILIAIAFVVLACGLLVTDFRIRAGSYLLYLGVGGFYGLLGYLNARSKRHRNPLVFSLLFFVSQIILVLVLLVSLGYLAAAANLPMQDKNLLAVDLAMGLDFRVYLGYINNHPGVLSAFAWTYDSIRWQLYAIVIMLPLLGHYRRAAEFALAFTVTLAITTVISTLFPATGVYETIGLHSADHPSFEPVVYYATLRELPLVRDGTTRLLDAFQLGPLLTFPSFHAISGVLYAWAVWPIRWLRVTGLAWNAVMIAATPIGGGHYFADVITGLAVAAATIWAVSRLGARLGTKREVAALVPLPVLPLLPSGIAPLVPGAETDAEVLSPQLP